MVIALTVENYQTLFKKGSHFSQKDLKNWKTIQRKPICKKYHGYEICGFPPPTSGGITVLQTLSILKF